MFVDYVKKTTTSAIDPTFVSFQVPLEQIYVNTAISATLHEMEAAGDPQNPRSQDFEKFRTDCKNFFVEAILQIQNRFDLYANMVMFQYEM